MLLYEYTNRLNFNSITRSECRHLRTITMYWGIMGNNNGSEKQVKL